MSDNRRCINYFHTGCPNEAGGLNSQWCDKCWLEMSPTEGENK